MAKNALQYITKSDPRYQNGARESEAGPSNAFDSYLSNLPGAEDYWRKLGYDGNVMSGTNGDAGGQQTSPELLAYLQSRGLQVGNDGQNAMNALIGPDGNPVAGSEYSVDDTGDFMRDALLVAGGGYFGGSALTGTGAFAGGAGAGAAASNPAVWNAALAESAVGTGGYGASSAGLGGGATASWGAGAGYGADAGAGLADSSFLGDISGQPGFDAMNVGADPGAGSLQTMGQAPMPQEFGALPQTSQGAVNGSSNLMSGIGDFFSGNSSMDSYLRAGQLVGGLYAQNKAAGAAQDGNNRQMDLLREQFQQNRTDNQPLLDTRNSALTQINGLLKDPSTITQQPGYQFGLKQGANQLNNRAAASGNYYSGAQMKAAQQYGQDYAGTKLDQSLNRLTTVAGLGQVGANNNQANNSNFGTQGGNALQQGGNIRGSGYLGSFNTANNAANGWMQDQLDRKYWGGGP